MKIIKYAWYAVVAISTLGLLAIIGPKVYNQIEYQFFDPLGDPSMWPATFEGILIFISILAAALALILGSNGKDEKVNRFPRFAFGTIGFTLLGMWVYGAKLWQDFHSSFLPQSLLDRMMSNDGSLIILISVVFHLTYAFSGRGIGIWLLRSYNRIKNKSEPDATGQCR
ncbi:MULTISPECIES: hypothetical protein [unclassified Lentimonas]|uniref:hypothetical protein n=1 Tax=unclassified Lentimonas TaxID=2630993 RepID=UPI00132A3360|nr:MULTISPECIES: hypothetical protein [unclassified Lentimonas]CAA6680118.1 Unannotated [Lentimonas sp. CC4]CAA6685098.1 Unannotated [Lentimonas sp. CC6]CAA6696638.1 Unannotated [Lentimonas sp. CC10]CAA6697433.1 Unannotated [Lentimonas sp. CC19]CAA7072508.1 Unannotated [Lentimonas sp. CC11]